jgi:hypothetical protein
VCPLLAARRNMGVKRLKQVSFAADAGSSSVDGRCDRADESRLDPGTRRSRASAADSSKAPREGSGPALSDLTKYAAYEPAQGEVVGGDSAADHLVKCISSALRDAVAAVDHLKRARQVLRNISEHGEMRSREMAQDFQGAASEVSSAVSWAPVLLRRADLTELFARKRFLVTAESAGKAANVVQKSEQWLKEIVRGIGRDLVVARREAVRVNLVDALL